MPRVAREKSSTGVYHIMLRGIDKRNIFFDNEDRMKFIEKVMKAKEVGKFELYGYCLMDNHIHLLIKENEEIGTSIKRIAVGYVLWHNNKYGRIGHLFQNRYMSEPVETERYLLTVIRYIHQNPVKATMVRRAKDYFWSSYPQYILSYEGHNCDIEPQLIKNYFKTIDDFISYMNAPNDDECLEHKPPRKYTDGALEKIIGQNFNINKINDLQQLPKEERDRELKEIYEKTGASIRQLERVLGVSKATIQRAIK